MKASTSGSWQPPPLRPLVGPQEVHVWLAGLAVDGAELAARSNWLSPEEQTKAASFRFPADRDAYTAVHGWMRRVLSDYAGCAPGTLHFVRRPGGKPALAAPTGAPPLEFNLSHSGSLALLAIASAGCAVGVDLEQIRPSNDLLELAEKFFAPGERAALRSRPVSEQTRAFYTCWTRKEAYVKARGDGLACALDRFEVSLDDPPALRHAADDPHASSRWSMWNVPSDATWVGTLVIERSSPVVRWWAEGG